MKWAESNGYKGSFDEICKLEGLKQYILKELTAVAQKNKVLSSIILTDKNFQLKVS